MKQNRNNMLILLFFTILLVLVFVYKSSVISSVLLSINLWTSSVFPTLFIMFVIQDILINYDLAYYIQIIFGKRLQKIFKVSTYGLTAFILSIVGGAPSSAVIINDMYSDDKISFEEANRLLKFSFFINPLFLLAMLEPIFDNSSISFKIIGILYLSNIMLAIIIPKARIKDEGNTFKNKNIFGEIFSKAISKSMNNTIIILGTITFFMIVGGIFNIMVSNFYLDFFTKSLLEITSALNFISEVSLNLKLKEIITVCIISFGGISIHFQIYAMIYKSKLNYKSFLMGRIYSMIISALIVMIW